MNCGAFIDGPVRDVPVVGRKLPMCTATGVSVSCANAQNALVLGRGVERAVRERGDHHAAVAEVEAALHLGDGVVDAGRRQDALADEATVGAVAELGQPVVVGADARDLELGLGAVDLGAEQGHARVQHLQVHPVDVHVGEAGLGVEASRAASTRSSRRRARSRGTTGPAVAVRPTGRTLSPSLNDQ